VRRYVRYRRALHDALTVDELQCKPYLDLLIEGFWFLFTADGRINEEEAAILATYLRKIPKEQRPALIERMTEDETQWIERLVKLPEAVHDTFIHALQVAAAVDKSVSLPEQKILSRATHALGRSFDMRQVEEMMERFESVGVLEKRKKAEG
jgi:hypothetical protein